MWPSSSRQSGSSSTASTRRPVSGATAAVSGASPGAFAVSLCSVASVGSVTVNIEPRPGPSLNAVTRPPCPTTMIRDSASPSPNVV